MSHDAYDPNAPEDKPSGNQYISKKDFRTILIAVGCLALLLYPVYRWAADNSARATCNRNVKAIFQAMEQYALDKDDRFPVVFYTEDGETPGGTESGLPRTWASDIAAYMNPRASFKCPSASAEDVSIVEGSSAWNGGKPIELSYGMYIPYSEVLRSTVENPNMVVIIAETSSGGANNTYNPKPLGKGDGYAIGWDNSNTQPTMETKFVTRLGFPNTSDGQFTAEDAGRHTVDQNGKPRGVVHALTANGSKFNLLPEMARVEMDKSMQLPTGTWATPIVRRRR